MAINLNFKRNNVPSFVADPYFADLFPKVLAVMFCLSFPTPILPIVFQSPGCYVPSFVADPYFADRFPKVLAVMCRLSLPKVLAVMFLHRIDFQLLF